MNLEQFPTNETALEMMGMITGNGFYDKSYAAKWLFQVMGVEMEDARKLLEELRMQAFPAMASWGLNYHELKYGLSSDGLDLDERREQINFHNTVRPSMSPAWLERILLDLTGRPVTVKDPKRSYIFKIIVHFDHDTGTDVLGGVKATVNRLKPSHLSYHLIMELEPILFINLFDFWMDTLDIHGMFQLEAMMNRFSRFQVDLFWQNRFSLDSDLALRSTFSQHQQISFEALDFLLRFFNLSEGNILDGRALLDGSWNLGTIYHKGLAFHGFEVAAFFNNYFGMAVTDDFCLQSENKNQWGLDELLIRLNTILEQDVTGHMDIRLRVQNTDENQMAVDYQVGMVNAWSACNIEDLVLTAAWNNVQKNRCQETNISFSVTNSYQFRHGSLTMDSIWYLDGSFPLNGTRNLKTEWNEEDI